eukprot:403362253
MFALRNNQQKQTNPVANQKQAPASQVAQNNYSNLKPTLGLESISQTKQHLNDQIGDANSAMPDQLEDEMLEQSLKLQYEKSQSSKKQPEFQTNALPLNVINSKKEEFKHNSSNTNAHPPQKQNSITDTQRFQQALDDLQNDELSQIQPLIEDEDSQIRMNNISKNAKFKMPTDIRPSNSQSKGSLKSNSHSLDKTKSESRIESSSKGSVIKQTDFQIIEDSKSIDFQMSDFEQSEIITTEDLIGLFTQKPQMCSNSASIQGSDQVNQFKPIQNQIAPQIQVNQQSPQFTGLQVQQNQRGQVKYSGISGISSIKQGPQSNYSNKNDSTTQFNDSLNINGFSSSVTDLNKRYSYNRGQYNKPKDHINRGQDQQQQVMNQSNSFQNQQQYNHQQQIQNQQQQTASQNQSSNHVDILQHYQVLLDQSNKQKDTYFQMLMQKDSQINEIFKQKEDYKDKYIQSLENQLQNKDGMLQQMITNLTEITQRSLSAQPPVSRRMDRDFTFPKNSSKQINQNESQNSSAGFKNLRERAKSSQQEENKNDESKSLNNVGFFRGGNKQIKMNIKPEHMNRIAKIFSDSDQESSKSDDSSKDEKVGFKAPVLQKEPLQKQKVKDEKIGFNLNNQNKKFHNPVKPDIPLKTSDVIMKDQDIAKKSSTYQSPQKNDQLNQSAVHLQQPQKNMFKFKGEVGNQNQSLHKNMELSSKQKDKKRTFQEFQEQQEDKSIEIMNGANSKRFHSNNQESSDPMNKRITVDDVKYLFAKDFKPLRVSIKEKHQEMLRALAEQSRDNMKDETKEFTKPLVYDIKSAKHFMVNCICPGQSDHNDKFYNKRLSSEILCKICSDKHRINYVELLKIFEVILKPSFEEFDQEWMMNAYSHVIWKFANFEVLTGLKLLNFENITFKILQKYNNEFKEGKRSFLQRIMQKDEGAHQHFIAVVSSIAQTQDSYELTLSDGQYYIKCNLKSTGFGSNDDQIIHLLTRGKIFVGQKLHLINQALTRVDTKPQLKNSSFVSQTKHFYLSQEDKFQLQLNYNGIWRARAFEKLGQQKPNKIMIKSLSSIAQRSGVIPMIDCIVVKKYPIYFTEFYQNENGQNCRLLRNKLAIESLQQKQIDRFNEKIKSMIEGKKTKDNGLEQHEIEQLRRKMISSFKMMFKVKVVDTLKPNLPAMVAFYEANEDIYSMISAGDRLRLSNLTPAMMSSDNMLNLNMIKSSKIIHFTQNVLKPKKQQDLIEQYKQLQEHSLSLSDFRAKFYSVSKDHDITVVGYLLKVISQKSQQNQYGSSAATQLNEEIWKIMILTHEQEIVCIEIQEKGFIPTKVFPKEGSYLLFDNLTYQQTVLLKRKDASIQMFETPQDSKTLIQDHKNQFLYDVLKMSIKGSYRMVTANQSEETQTIKLLVKEKSVLKQAEQRVKMIMNQGLKRSDGAAYSQHTQNEVSELSEIVEK